MNGEPVRARRPCRAPALAAVVPALVAVVPALAAAGCLPFAAPPAKVGFGVGPGALPQRTLSRASLPDGERPGGVASQFSAGLYPLAWFESARERPGDVGVGYRLERYSGDGPDVHGPYLDLELYPWRHRRAGRAFRLGSIATPSLLFWRDAHGQRKAGAGMDLKLELELYGFVPGVLFADDQKNDVGGYAHGEWSLGVWVGGGYRDVLDSHVWTGWLGFSARWPAVAGLLCCWLPGSD